MTEEMREQITRDPSAPTKRGCYQASHRDSPLPLITVEKVQVISLVHRAHAGKVIPTAVQEAQVFRGPTIFRPDLVIHETTIIRLGQPFENRLDRQNSLTWQNTVVFITNTRATVTDLNDTDLFHKLFY